LQDYMSLRAAIMICAILVNTHTHAHKELDSLYQWSFRGGTRGNAVPIVKEMMERRSPC